MNKLIKNYFCIEEGLLLAIDNSSSKSALSFMSVMLLIGPLAIAFAITALFYMQFEMALVKAIVLGIVLGCCLAMVDRHICTQRIKSQDKGLYKKEFLALRVMTISIMAFLAVNSSAELLRESIDAVISKQVSEAMDEAMAKDTQIRSLQNQLSLLIEKQQKNQVLIDKKGAVQQQLLLAEAGMKSEIGGISLDGTHIQSGAGPKYKAHRLKYEMSQKEIVSIEQQITQLDFDIKELNKVSSLFNTRRNELYQTILIEHDGNINRLAALIKTANEQPIYWLYILLIVVLLAGIDLMYFLALSTLPMNDTLRSLFSIQEQREQSNLHSIREQHRREIQDLQPEKIIYLPRRQ